MKICLFFACLVSLLYTVRGQAPVIVEDILPEVKRKGQSGYLNCTVTRQGVNKVWWMHDDHHITSDTKVVAYNQEIEGRFKYAIEKRLLGNDKTTYTITVNRLREEDGGRYICKIYLQGISNVTLWPTKFGNLTVQVPPSILVSETSNTEERKQGEAVKFRCNATGSPMPNITWIRADGRPLPNGQLSHRGHNYSIPSVKKDDRGTYRCVADNTVIPPAHHDAKLVIYFYPESQPVQDTVGQAQNRRFSAILECRIAGMPEPNLRWFKQTSSGLQLLSNNEKYEISQMLNHGSSVQDGEIWYAIKIRNVQANDYTDYYCEGHNNLGSSRAIVRLYETNECQGPACPSVGASGGTSRNSQLPSYFLFVLISSTIWMYLRITVY